MNDAREYVRTKVRKFDTKIIRRWGVCLFTELEEFSADEVTDNGKLLEGKDPATFNVGPSFFGPAKRLGWIKANGMNNSKSVNRHRSQVPQYAVCGKGSKAGALILEALDEYERAQRL